MYSFPAQMWMKEKQHQCRRVMGQMSTWSLQNSQGQAPSLFSMLCFRTRHKRCPATWQHHAGCRGIKQNCTLISRLIYIPNFENCCLGRCRNYYRKEIKDLEKKFKEYCCQRSQKIGLNELKVEIAKTFPTSDWHIVIFSTWWKSWGLLKTTSR